MPLFRIKGRAPDETYLFDENPDPDRYEAVEDVPEPVAVKASKPAEKAAPAAQDEE